MDNPGSGISRALDGPSPLDESSLLSYVYLLTGSDQPHHGAPLGNSFREFDEVLGFRSASDKTWNIRMLNLHLFSVEGPLGFVKNQDVFGRD